jgi:hypothetical protein
MFVYNSWLILLNTVDAKKWCFYCSATMTWTENIKKRNVRPPSRNKKISEKKSSKPTNAVALRDEPRELRSCAPQKSEASPAHAV